MRFDIGQQYTESMLHRTVQVSHSYSKRRTTLHKVDGGDTNGTLGKINGKTIERQQVVEPIQDFFGHLCI